MDERPLQHDKPDTSGGFDPNYSVRPSHIQTAQRILRRDGELTRLNVHPQWAAVIRRRAYVANAHASASIEGNPLTLEEAEAVAQAAEDGGSRPADSDEREILQHLVYFRSLESLATEDAVDLTASEIEDAHQELLTGVLDRSKRIGRLRGPGNEAAVYVGALACTPWKRVKAELDELGRWYYGAGSSLPTPIRVAIWFHEFESIHPFRDGNGRVGRALTHRLLRTDGLPNSPLVALDTPFNDDRPAYYEALASTHRTGRLDDWVSYFLRCLEATYDATLARFDGLAEIPGSMAGAERAVLETIIQAGLEQPRVRDLGPRLDDYEPVTISLALATLADHGWLVHNGRRGRASAYGPGPKLTAKLDPERTT